MKREAVGAPQWLPDQNMKRQNRSLYIKKAEHSLSSSNSDL